MSFKYKDNFAIFILSHESPDKILTMNAIHKVGNYTGKWYIILDDEDKCIEQYKKNWGEDHILLYNKDEWEKKIDMMDMGGRRGITVFVRNACFELAKQIGVQYFMELDEDYSEICYRCADKDDPKILRNWRCFSLDDVLEAMLDFFVENKQMKTLCMGQNGDLIGGTENFRFKQRIIRKAMNSFICDVERPFTFFGRMNDDVNAYCLHGSRGELFLTIMDACVSADSTQSHSGGMTEIYKADGTFKKSFYTVMCCPSSVKINIMGQAHFRIHHSINWETTVPKIISSKYKK